MADFETFWKEIEAEAEKLLAKEERGLVRAQQPLFKRIWNSLKYICSFRWLSWRSKEPTPKATVCERCSKEPCECIFGLPEPEVPSIEMANDMLGPDQQVFRPGVPKGYHLDRRPPPPAPML